MLHTGIDIFSPRFVPSTRSKSVVPIHQKFRLDISPSSAHAKRRIWQEAISTIFLTTPSCKIPKEQRMEYAESSRNEYAPYLLNFLGSPGERHAENVKVRANLKTLSIWDLNLCSDLPRSWPPAYGRAVSLVYGPDYDWFRSLEERIQKEFVGPDCYWKTPPSHMSQDAAGFLGMLGGFRSLLAW
jgi:hypothetical protein